MTFTWKPGRRLLRSIALATIGAPLALAILTGCSRVGGDATQVAVKVNDTEISLAQLQYVVGRQPPVSARMAEGRTRQILEHVVDEELAAQGAQKLGLDKDPRIVQALESAKRQVLAQAYMDAVADKAALPSSDEIDRYFDAHPALFAQRRFYDLQEVSLQGPRDELAALQPKVESAEDAGAAADLIRKAHLESTSRRLTISPEDVPLALLDKLAVLRAGQSLMVAQPNGARVLTLLSSTAAPLGREAARPMIQAFLTNENKRRAMQGGLKAQRKDAHIEYKGKFAPGPDPAASGVALDAQRPA